MTTINQSASTTTTTTSDATSGSSAKTKALSGDFDSFLKMLTVQMKNQDPLNPIESADFAVQLATFSGVEQQAKTNKLLTDLATQLTGTGLASIADWIGREVPAAGPANFSGTPLTLVPETAEGATNTMLEVRTEGGQLVQSMQIPAGNDPLQWAGVGSSGDPLTPGRYIFETVSYKNGEELSRKATPVYRTVTEVRSGAGGAELVLDGGLKISPDAVTSLRLPGQQTEAL